MYHPELTRFTPIFFAGRRPTLPEFCHINECKVQISPDFDIYVQKMPPKLYFCLGPLASVYNKLWAAIWMIQNLPTVHVFDSGLKTYARKKLSTQGRIFELRPLPPPPPHIICSSEFPRFRWEISPSGCSLSDIFILFYFSMKYTCKGEQTVPR